MRTITTILSLACLAFTAFASMPELSRFLRARTDGACREWATNQGEDARYAWGMQEDGSSSLKSATARLRDECRGFAKPEIVGFGSSAGFDEAYCARHPGFRICANATGPRDVPNTAACVVDDPSQPLNLRDAPDGRVTGSVDNGKGVRVLNVADDVRGKAWAYVADGRGEPLGWVFRSFVRCSK